MLLASYTSTRPGLQGVANVLIRTRLRGQYSHTEVVLEPGDGVDHLVPDGTLQPDADGALWSMSSVAAELLPDYSPRRAGHKGGVRWKRIAYDRRKWDLLPLHRDPEFAVSEFLTHQGEPYDWQLVAGQVIWLIPGKASRKHCSEMAALMCGVPDKDAGRFDPCTIRAMVFSEQDIRRL